MLIKRYAQWRLEYRIYVELNTTIFPFFAHSGMEMSEKWRIIIFNQDFIFGPLVYLHSISTVIHEGSVVESSFYLQNEELVKFQAFLLQNFRL